jgi:hypothetical protein
MAVIQSGVNPSDLWTIDTTSKAGRMTEYRTDGSVYQPIPTGVYSFCIQDVAGVAAANNFLSLFNPAASAKTLKVFRIQYNAYAVAVTVAKASIHIGRITTATVGTLQAAAAICSHKTTFPAPTAEVRTAGPTVTAAAEWLGYAPPVVITAAGADNPSSFEWSADNPDELLTLAAGEGIVFRQTVAGDVDETFNFKVGWMEF